MKRLYLVAAGVLFALALALAACGKTNPPIEPDPPEETDYTPVIGSTAYTYDKAAAGDFELPIDIKGKSLSIIEIDDVLLPATNYTLRENPSVIAFAENWVLALNGGAYKIAVLTTGGSVEFTLTVSNTVSTGFDEITERTVELGKSAGATFSVDFGGTSVKKIVSAGYELAAGVDYTAGASSVTVTDTFLQKTYGLRLFTLTLTNNDTYDFSVTSNQLFYTDYDVTTIHNALESTTGQNPLYQSTTQIAIIDAPMGSGFTGRVLRFEPLPAYNEIRTHGIFTLQDRARLGFTWYDAGFVTDKSYYISFDYMTVGTTAGEEFSFHTVNNKRTANLNSGRAGVKQRFEAVWSGADIDGIMLWGVFAHGGYVLVDNFGVMEIEPNGAPTAVVLADSINEEEALEIAFTGRGYSLVGSSVLIDGNPFAFTLAAGVITVSAAELEILSLERHYVTIQTTLCRIEGDFLRYARDRVAELRDTSADYVHGTTDEIKLFGTFDNDITILSLKQKVKINTDGAQNYYASDTDFNFAAGASYVTLTTGLGDAGYLTLKAAFLDSFYETTEFTVAYSNGLEETVTLTTNSLFYSDYDVTSIKAAQAWTVLSSGFDGVANIAEYEDGNKGLVITEVSASSADRTWYTIKFHEHVWGWYQLNAKPSKLFRITFDYKLTGLADGDVNAVFIIGDDYTENFYGGGSEFTLDASPADWDEVIFPFSAAGTHIDTGWFTVNNPRLFKIRLPAFGAGDGKQIVFDNFRITEVDAPVERTANDYIIGSGDYEFALDTFGFVGLKLWGTETTVPATFAGGKVIVPQTAMAALLPGDHIELAVETSQGVFRHGVTAVTAKADLSETAKTFARGDAQVKFAGDIDSGVTVTGVTKTGTNYWDDSRLTPKSIALTHFEVETDGLIVKQSLLDILYDVTTLYISLSNGAVKTVTLTSNVMFYTNFDETSIHEASVGNIRSCQDTDMRQIVSGLPGLDGNAYMYTPTDAVLGHSTTGNDNRIQTFSNKKYNNWWWEFEFDDDGYYEIFFDYAVIKPTGNPVYYFTYINSLSAWVDTPLTAGQEGGSFSITVKGDSLIVFGIGCDFSTLQSDSFMIIDNYGFAKVAAPAG
ncbi:MAG: hypothetical protein LBS99_07415 [Clostridiales bacterium]|jgi:hypothetical protein|nr:hypothetical protein [Clostridiales bacterium]